MEKQYWSLAQVVAWAALRQDDIVARVGEAKDALKQLGSEFAQAGLLSQLDYFDINYFQLLRYGHGITISGRKSAGGPLEVIPKESFHLLTLGGACLNDNSLRKKTRQDFLDGLIAMDGGLEKLPAEARAKFLENLDATEKVISSLPDWRDLAFDPAEIKTAFEPYKEHEALWTLSETIGFVGLGYPLSVNFGYGAEGQKKLAVVKEKLRLALQGGKLTAYGRPYDARQNHLELRYQKLEADDFVVDAHQFKMCEILGTIELSYRILDVRFKSEDVRALFQPVDAVAAQDCRKQGYRKGALDQAEAKKVSRAGRKQKYDWPAFHAECSSVWQHHGGFVLGDEDFCQQSDLERIMTVWTEERWGKAPAESTIRAHVSQWLTSQAEANKADN